MGGDGVVAIIGVLSLVVGFGLLPYGLQSLAARFIIFLIFGAWIFAAMVAFFDTINEYLIDWTIFPDAFVWLWFYMRFDLLFSFIGPAIAFGMMVKLVRSIKT